jgi:LacI family transcriptional regulator
MTRPTGGGGGTRTGIQQVAERAGVAASSVSRVLSGHPNVSELMRNRVVDAVAALGYEPNLLAQSLRTQATMTVGFVVGNIANPLLSEIALGAETSLRAAGYAMLLANSMDNPELDHSHIRLFAQRRVDGLLLSVSDESSRPTIELLDKITLPLVLVDRELKLTVDASAVLADHSTGISAAARHLAALGHKTIALVNGPSTVRPARERAATLRRVCRQLKMDCIVRSGAFTTDHGERTTSALLAKTGAPSALIAGSNQILVGVLRAVRSARLRIPRDLSLVTCDEVPLTEFFVPPLATIQRSPYEMGVTAANLLLELFAGAAPRAQSVPTSFRPTSSCGPPRAGQPRSKP